MALRTYYPVTNGTKYCPECQKILDVAQFHKNRRVSDGYMRRCKDCENLKQKHWRANKTPEQKARKNQVSKEYYLKNKERIYQKTIENRSTKGGHKAYLKNWYLKRTFGISLYDYNNILEQQEHKCAICKTPAEELPKALCVDHCHITGKIRGLLCNHCNTAIGHLRDNPILIARTLRYVAENMEGFNKEKLLQDNK